MYSGPSGQATTIRTNDPNRIASPRVDSTRPSQVAPSETSDGVLHGRRGGTGVAALVRGRCGRGRRRAARRPGVEPELPGVVSSGDGVVELSTVKPNEPSAPSSPLGCSVDQVTLHSLAGIGTRIGTVRVRPSALRTTSPVFGGTNGSPAHAIVTVESPTGPSNVSTTWVGGDSSSAPSSGDVLCRSATWAWAGPVPSRSAPTTAASTATRNRSMRPGTPVRVGTTGTR